MAAGGDPMGTSGDVSNWAQIGAFILAALAMIGAAIMRFAGVERLIHEKTSEVKFEYNRRIDEEMKAFGETNAAIRQKVSDNELKALQTFVQRDEFRQSIEQVNRNIDTLRTSTEDKLDRLRDALESNRQSIQEKLDKLLSRGQ